MKVFMATFVSENYGTLLQAYALQCKLRELDVTPILIEFPQRAHTNEQTGIIQRFRSFFCVEKHYSLIHKIRRKAERSIFRRKRLKVSRFISDNLTMDSYTSCIDQIENEKCILLAGSDQIWNTLNRPINGFYLFDYVQTDNKRCSYAASIGISDLDETQKKYYAEALKGFYSISFREKIAYDLLHDYLVNPIVRYDLDPTLLYNKSFWIDFTNSEVEKKPYIFVYMLRPDKRLITMARIVSKRTGYKIVFLGQYNDVFIGCKTLFAAGVEDFLSAIANAEMVITNSFHCTVFSIIFEKKFVSVEIESTSSSVKNLLSMLSLQNRLIKSIKSLDVIYQEYDTEYVNEILEKERKKSLDYLYKIIVCTTDKRLG